MRNLRQPLFGLAAAGLLGATLFGLAACGDDDSSGGGGGGTDQSYMAAVCKSTVNFGKAIEAADKTGTTSPTDPAAVKAVGEAFDTYAKDLKAAKPPSDVASFNGKLVSAIEASSKALKDSKDLSKVELPDVKPDAAIKDRLDKVAAGIQECKDAGWTSS